MARLSDIPGVFRTVGPWTLTKRVWQQVGEDNVFTWGAAMAYSWLFAIFPFLVFLLSLVPFVPSRFKEDVRTDVANFVDDALPESVGTLVMTQVENVLDKPSAGGFLSFGLLLMVWASSGGMAMTMSALDKAYDIEKGRPYYKHRLLAILLTIVAATLVILVMILLPVGTGILKWLESQGRIFSWVLYLVNIARYAIALLLMFSLLAILYHFGPSFKQEFHPITPGAVFSVAVWLLLGFVFRIYLTKFGGAANYNKTYGAVAGAAILLLFFYIDALVLLIGAEINSEIDFALCGEHGVAPPAHSKPVPKAPDSVKPS